MNVSPAYLPESQGQTQSRTLQLPVPTLALSDAVLAFWWRLTPQHGRS
jgi:hypothetical protein